MSGPKLQPSFFDAFRDPRFLVTLLAILGTAFVAYYRIGQLEKNQEKYEDRFIKVEDSLRAPRYTLEDDEKRMSAWTDLHQREMDRRAQWMDEQNKFRIQMVEFATESRAAIKELRGLVEELKEVR